MHIGQAAINPVMAERQLFVIDSELMQNRRVQVIAVGGINRGLV
jgi:hypothetical protein